MATKSEQYQQVLDNIAAGDPMAAYNGFTQLPFSEQMMLYMTPGVGDAIAFVESADFFDKAGTARQEGRYGDMIGSGLSGGIAAASMLPFAGSVVDAARVGGKTVERGIGSLMNRVNARMDDGIPGGGGGSRGGGSNTAKIQELENRKKELIRDHEAMTERMPTDEASKYYPYDKIDEIDDQIVMLSKMDSESAITKGTKPFSKIEENKLKVSNKSQILNKLMRERETEYQYMTPKQLSALDARISKLKAELTGN